MCISVDLPDPDAPMIAAKRPAGKAHAHVDERVDRRLPLAEAAAQVLGLDDLWASPLETPAPLGA